MSCDIDFKHQSQRLCVQFCLMCCTCIHQRVESKFFYQIEGNVKKRLFVREATQNLKDLTKLKIRDFDNNYGSEVFLIFCLLKIYFLTFFIFKTFIATQ